MQRDLASLEGRIFDLIVIGGGMFGAAAALDAAQRGLDVALIERGDFCGATSAHSYKMIHGGIRYLQHGDLARVRMSATARAVFLRIAPHLAHPLPIVVPTYGRLGMKSLPVLRAGLAAYDLLTMGCNHGIKDPTRRIPRGRSLTAEEVKQRYPGLPSEGLTGAGVFCDGQMDDPPRLVLAFLKSAEAHGAALANYLEVTGFLHEGSRVTGVVARDRLCDERLTVRGRLVLNASGPYAEHLLERALGKPVERRTPFSRDAYFIVPRPLIEGDAALTLPARVGDADARLSRGGRHLFLVPWRGVTLVGVWHKVYPGHPDHYEIEDEELASWIEEVEEAYPGLGLSLDEVSLGSAGLVPFGEDDPNASKLKFAHRSRFVDHAVEDGIEGLITLIGVRYTTGPIDAVQAVDRALLKLGSARAPSRLAHTPLHGGDIDDFEGLVRAIEEHQITPTVARALAHRHGTAYAEVLAHNGHGAPLEGSDVLEAEIVHAAHAEMALRLDDVVFRRTGLATTGVVRPAALERSAAVMASAHGWSRQRLEAETAEVRERLAGRRSGRSMLAGGPSLSS